MCSNKLLSPTNPRINLQASDFFLALQHALKFPKRTLSTYSIKTNQFSNADSLEAPSLHTYLDDSKHFEIKFFFFYQCHNSHYYCFIIKSDIIINNFVSYFIIRSEGLLKHSRNGISAKTYPFYSFQNYQSHNSQEKS